jgi:hypothetical protein
MTDDQRIEALEELLVECTEGLIARGGHGDLVAHPPSVLVPLPGQSPPWLRRTNVWAQMDKSQEGVRATKSMIFGAAVFARCLVP